MANQKLIQVNVQVDPAHKPLIMLLGKQLRAGALTGPLGHPSALAATVSALTLTAHELIAAVTALQRAVSGPAEADARTAVPPPAAVVAPAGQLPIQGAGAARSDAAGARPRPPCEPRLADRLRDARVAKGWSRSALRDALAAALAGTTIPRQRVHDWETGRCRPSAATKTALCQLLEIAP